MANILDKRSLSCVRNSLIICSDCWYGFTQQKGDKNLLQRTYWPDIVYSFSTAVIPLSSWWSKSTWNPTLYIIVRRGRGNCRKHYREKKSLSYAVAVSFLSLTYRYSSCTQTMSCTVSHENTDRAYLQRRPYRHVKCRLHSCHIPTNKWFVFSQT